VGTLTYRDGWIKLCEQVSTVGDLLVISLQTSFVKGVREFCRWLDKIDLLWPGDFSWKRFSHFSREDSLGHLNRARSVPELFALPIGTERPGDIAVKAFILHQGRAEWH